MSASASFSTSAGSTLPAEMATATTLASISHPPPSQPSTPDPDISRILSFWFDIPPDTTPSAYWFSPSPTIDTDIRTRFLPLITQARSTSDLDTWSSTPLGSLALVLLLDQFPRNVYRGSPLAFASDSKALHVASHAIAAGFDRHLPSVLHASFMYVPLMHDESLVSQIASCALFDVLLQRCREGENGAGEDEVKHLEMSLPFGHKHRDVIVKFGRFPGRNKALGRQCTEEEDRYLEEHPMGF